MYGWVIFLIANKGSDKKLNCILSFCLSHWLLLVLNCIHSYGVINTIFARYVQSVWKLEEKQRYSSSGGDYN